MIDFNAFDSCVNQKNTNRSIFKILDNPMLMLMYPLSKDYYFIRRGMLFWKYYLFYLFNGFYVSLKLKGMTFCVWYRIIRYNICRIGL